CLDTKLQTSIASFAITYVLLKACVPSLTSPRCRVFPLAAQAARERIPPFVNHASMLTHLRSL
ncbi:hypothetical protein, partial [Gallintestinimicrobium sp.]|uniref:hypothetical protein n=1 Tax=Gallintestinimicrobium sp. TaxID=2981655 RepID=UPI0039948B52